MCSAVTSLCMRTVIKPVRVDCMCVCVRLSSILICLLIYANAISIANGWLAERVECIIETCHGSNEFITQINHHQHVPCQVCEKFTHTCTHTHRFRCGPAATVEVLCHHLAQTSQLCMGRTRTRILRQNVFISGSAPPAFA